MRTKIKNWTGAHAVSVGTLPADANCAGTVGLSYSEGPILFNFHMLPDQAEELAAALITNANEIRAAVKVAA